LSVCLLLNNLITFVFCLFYLLYNVQIQSFISNTAIQFNFSWLHKLLSDWSL
jgi:hypothetical protein